MSSKGIVIALVLGMGLMSVGCTDTCREACNFAADYVESCMPEPNAHREHLDPDWTQQADYQKACIETPSLRHDRVGN